MLERYIEKNIFRQVYLCQQLYQKKKIALHTMAERLNVCTITITNDLELLKESFGQEILTFERTKNTCKASFSSAYSLLELTQRIFRRSDFLRVLNDFLSGNTHWSEIAEKEFLSTSKIYQIRADIFEFAEELGYLQSDHTIKLPEKDLRYLLLAISRYTGDRSAIPYNKMIASSAADLIDYVEEHFFDRDYPSSEREIIILGSQLSSQRARQFPIQFSDDEKQSAQQTPLFGLLREGVKTLKSTICTNEEELFFIYSLFNARNYLCNNLELLQKDFEVVYQTWANMQLFQPDVIYLLDNDQQELYQTVQHILNQWAADYQTEIHWNENLIRKMTLTFDLLRRNTVDEKVELYIVAPSDFNFLYYRKQLKALLDDHFIISNMIYNTLNEVVDDVFFCSKRIIVCDTALYQPDLGSENTLIFPVSLQTINSTCFEINQVIRTLEKEAVTEVGSFQK